MSDFSKLYSEVQNAHDHATQLQREAEVRRLLRESGDTQTPLRARLAAQLRALAERLEPHPHAKESLS